MKKFLLPVFIILVLVLAAGAYFLIHKPAADPTAWKTYDNKTYGFSLQYPPTFELQESKNADGGSFMLSVSDPSTRVVYSSIYIWLTPSSQGDVSDYFTGPYPKELPPRGNTSSTTVVERTLNGAKGIEYYGYGGEGTSFDDVFMYKDKYLWAVSLDPVDEGRTTEEREPGAPVPDKAIYQRIRSSIRISP